MAPKQKILIAAGALVVVGVVVAVMVSIGTSKPRVELPAEKDLARLQIRSDPSNMEVLVRGHAEGRTPKMVLVPRSDTPIPVAVMFAHGKVITKNVVPNLDHQVIDFKP
ncbi:MAG: hypothetical protein QM831_13970 [Kofleriaceae bacterium]